MFQLTFTQVC